MFVPFDQLYYFLEQSVNDDTIIYCFTVPGSRKMVDINLLHDYKKTAKEKAMSILMLMHDQEPLNFGLYQSVDTEFINQMSNEDCAYWKNIDSTLSPTDFTSYRYNHWEEHNLFRWRLTTIYDRWLLCHSELNSSNLNQYEEIGAVGVYWWSHAMIAKDWYRFAMLDRRLTYDQFDRDFVVYNRAWSGTREYRLKFSELVLQYNLQNCCSIKFAPMDNNVHYQDHVYKNPNFKVTQDLTVLPENSTTSTASADYSWQDYQQCAIDVVLETLFDDNRQHLTEKTLRPIACGKPFLLVGTAGSLQYLKQYGFQTFGELIDESYDAVQDPAERLHRVCREMLRISLLPQSEKNALYKNMHEIARFNQQWFWSDKFSQTIINEFVENYNSGYEICKATPGGKQWTEARKYVASLSPFIRKALTQGDTMLSRQDLVALHRAIKR